MANRRVRLVLIVRPLIINKPVDPLEAGYILVHFRDGIQCDYDLMF